VLCSAQPDLVLVVGDVNSTLAGAITATKLGIRLAHVEAGLRSFDRTMPEEVNRVLTDSISDLLFTTEPAANENLAREGIPSDRIHFVGNVMIDTLFHYRERSRASTVLEALVVKPQGYSLLTLHRPSNVDSEETLRLLLGAVARIQEECPVVFPVHPRTRQHLERLNGHLPTMANLRLVNPLPYLDFVQLMANARCVLTDSGGIQEETTALGVPLPHPPKEHRATGHGEPGHQQGDRSRSACDLRRVAPRPPTGSGPLESCRNSGTARPPSAS
jgi:UDP-N-acetylglucosamine 2-epimerase (non-hydrolysing)